MSEEQIGEVVGRVIDGLEALGIRSAEQGREEERSRITREAQAIYDQAEQTEAYVAAHVMKVDKHSC